MSNGPAFIIDKKPVKDMTDAELNGKLQQLGAELQAAGIQMNASLQQMQLTASMLNVVKYELDRRANSIHIAHTIPH